MEEKVLIPYAPNLIESTRSIGYSFETALADIIDNSISNFASRVDVKFDGGESPFVAIIDNGLGMTSHELVQAMRYGSSSSLDERDENDLGRFGLGLKMASMSQCRKLTVISKNRGNISAVSWDLDYINETQDWTLIQYSGKEINKIKFSDALTDLVSGTVVLWEKLDRISESQIDFEREFNEKLDFSDKHISLVFHRFLENKSSKLYFELYFNNRKLEPIDPYLLNNKATQPLEEETLFINRIPITIKPFIMPFISKLSVNERQMLNRNRELNLNQGLYIYRNKRLIVWGKWFRIIREGELNRLAKIRIDLPNSIDQHWTIDVKKSSAAIPGVIKDQLKQIVLRTVGKSERVYRYRGRKTSNDTFEHVWNKIEVREKFMYQINRELPMYKILEENLNDTQNRMLENFIRSIEDAFPYMSVYYDVAKDTEFVEKTLSVDEAYETAKLILNTQPTNVDAQKAIIKNLQNIDLFIKYPEVFELLEKENMYEQQ